MLLRRLFQRPPSDEPASPQEQPSGTPLEGVAPSPTLTDVDFISVQHRSETGASSQSMQHAPMSHQFATDVFRCNGRTRVVEGKIQAQMLLRWLKTDVSYVLTHREILAAYNEFALHEQIDPLPWNSIARHFSSLIKRSDRPSKTYEYRMNWERKVRIRIRIYIIPKG